MKQTILLTLGVAGMVYLGYVTAVHSQDMVWLLVPFLALIIAVVAVSKMFR